MLAAAGRNADPMRLLRSILLALLATLPQLATALDLTPVENWREQEGVRIATVIFNDDAGKIRYQPPGDWRLDGSPDRLSLYPPQQGAFMQMRLFQRRPQQAGAAPEDLSKWALIFTPQDADELALADERPSPFTLSGRPSHEFIYAYNSGGQRFQTGIAICDLDERQRLVVIITARQPDFANVHDTGIASLFSWSKRK